jgi:hypothetical protein
MLLSLAGCGVAMPVPAPLGGVKSGAPIGCVHAASADNMQMCPSKAMERRDLLLTGRPHGAEK